MMDDKYSSKTSTALHQNTWNYIPADRNILWIYSFVCFSYIFTYLHLVFWLNLTRYIEGLTRGGFDADTSKYFSLSIPTRLQTLKETVPYFLRGNYPPNSQGNLRSPNKLHGLVRERTIPTEGTPGIIKTTYIKKNILRYKLCLINMSDKHEYFLFCVWIELRT
jgi:hypothetical protein